MIGTKNATYSRERYAMNNQDAMSREELREEIDDLLARISFEGVLSISMQITPEKAGILLEALRIAPDQATTLLKQALEDLETMQGHYDSGNIIHKPESIRAIRQYLGETK